MEARWNCWSAENLRRNCPSPGPDQEALEKMFRALLRAPDHGRLRPWRFVVVPEEKRERFGELMADCLRRQQPDASADMLQRERECRRCARR